MPIDAGSLHYLVGPLAALFVVGGLILFIRWAMAPARRRADDPADGLLSPIATTTTRESALALRAVLSDAGIRSTIRPRSAGRISVLVFPADLDAAAPLVAGYGVVDR